MTDRLNTLTVALEKDIRVDDAQGLIDAILRMRGVLSVTGNVADGTAWMAEERARRELGEKLWQVIYPKKDA
jgi:hypothetical protein